MPILFRICCLSLLCCLLGASAPAPTGLRPGKDYALFFAVNRYQDPAWKNLNNPIRDAEAIAKELREVYGFETTIHRNQSRRQILQTLLAWQQKAFAADAQLLVFFSGHGTFSEAFTQGFFVPADGKGDDPLHESHLELTQLGNLVTNIACPHTLLAIDACYSGTIDREIAFKGRPAFERPRPTPDYDPRQPTIELQLRNRSRLLLTSGGKERTPDGSAHSPFAGAILKGLRQAYTTGDGLVLFSDLLALLERVRPTPHAGQLPGHADGGFVFVGPRAQPKPIKLEPKVVESVVRENKDLIPLPTMVRIPGGTFTMGSNEGEADEKPLHEVTISPFYLAETEVTVAQFEAFVQAKGYETEAEKKGGSYFWNSEKSEWELRAGVDWRCDAEGKPRLRSDYQHPVIHVSWNDAQAYCQWLSQRSGDTYRLPTEAEWEYAAGNGDLHTRYSWGNGEPKGKKGGNVTDETRSPSGSTWTKKFEGYNDGYWYDAPVAGYEPNRFGLYDMTGNVWEWCSDWYGSNYYASSPSRDPQGPSSGSCRVFRGGSWSNDPVNCRVANRHFGPAYRDGNVGFRVARSF